MAQSQYGTKDSGASGNVPVSGFDPKNSQFHGSDTEIRALYEAFQKNGKVDLNEFLDILQKTAVNDKCSILVDKIRKYKQNSPAEVDFKVFQNLFKFDLANKEDFMYTFKAIDKSQSFSIGPGELEAASHAYDLNLKRDDIKLMIDNLKQKNVDSVTADELYNTLYGAK